MRDLIWSTSEKMVGLVFVGCSAQQTLPKQGASKTQQGRIADTKGEFFQMAEENGATSWQPISLYVDIFWKGSRQLCACVCVCVPLPGLYLKFRQLFDRRRDSTDLSMSLSCRPSLRHLPSRADRGCESQPWGKVVKCFGVQRGWNDARTKRKCESEEIIVSPLGSAAGRSGLGWGSDIFDDLSDRFCVQQRGAGWTLGTCRCACLKHEAVTCAQKSRTLPPRSAAWRKVIIRSVSQPWPHRASTSRAAGAMWSRFARGQMDGVRSGSASALSGPRHVCPGAKFVSGSVGGGNSGRPEDRGQFELGRVRPT